MDKTIAQNLIKKTRDDYNKIADQLPAPEKKFFGLMYWNRLIF
jgi:hypothetical protein